MSHGLSWYSGLSAKFISSVRLSLTSRYKLVLASPQFCHHNITSFYFLPTASLIEIFYLLAFERRRQWHPTLVLLPGKSHGRRSLVGCSPWDCEESDTTERFHFPFWLSCIGEGNSNPLQCSWLENPRDGGAWWAAVYGVAQSRTRLKRLSTKMGRRPEGLQMGIASHIGNFLKHNSVPWKFVGSAYYQMKVPAGNPGLQQCSIQHYKYLTKKGY